MNRIHIHCTTYRNAFLRRKLQDLRKISSLPAFDSRANAKIETLENLKSQADNTSDNNVNVIDNQALALAYAQAIKYTSRSRSTDAAAYTTQLLSEAVERAGGPPVPAAPGRSDTEFPKPNLVKNWPDLDDVPNSDDGSSSNGGISMDDDDALNFPIPDRKAFHQTLHAWGDSKVRRKGVYAENVLRHMAVLRDLKFDTVPDSKAFAITVKCWAGSTHRHSLDHIIKLHQLHDQFAECGVDGIIRDEPFFLMHSIKALKNYNVPLHEKLASKWFDRLHTYVMNTDNQGPVSDVVIDLSGTYTGIIREYAKARLKTSPIKAKLALQRMHEIQSSSGCTAKVDIQQNAYDLTITCLRDSRRKDDATEAIEMLAKMVEAWHNNGNDGLSASVPSPSQQSFVYCLQALVHVGDADEAVRQADKVLAWLDIIYASESPPFEMSTDPYDAIIYFYASVLAGKSEVLRRVASVVRTLKRRGKKHPEMKPDVKTWSAVLKSCSAVAEKTHQDEGKKEALAIARDTFQHLVDDQNVGVYQLTDDCFFHMMKCIKNLSSTEISVQNEIIDVFSKACGRGLVSSPVLKILRSSVPDQVYESIVGSGRLADSWTENVTSIKALYTDGTRGGSGKNARRKGKSTSNWWKNQKAKEGKKVAMGQARKQRQREKRSKR